MCFELKEECLFVLLVDLTELVLRLLHMRLAFALADADFRNVNEPNLKINQKRKGEAYCSIFILSEFRFHSQDFLIMNLLDVVAHFIALLQAVCVVIATKD